MSIREDIASVYEEVLLFSETEYDAAIVGMATRCGLPDLVVYDFDKLKQIIMDRDGCDADEATEWITVNMMGSYAGERTPLVLNRWWGAGA